MQTEIEAKFLNIDPAGLRSTLEKANAHLIHPERPMRRKAFDYPDSRLEKIGGWVRVRDEGDKITMSYKQLNERTIQGTKEVSFTVSDFEYACLFPTSIGLEQKAYQETKRERYELNGVEITIDTWPWIPTFVELEGTTEAALKKIAEQLGLKWNDALFGSVENAYQTYYNVTEAEVDGWPIMTLTPVPDWLEKKRKINS